MGLSDIIEQFIVGLLEKDSVLSIQRSSLAKEFNCVPSQINYVIQTRFTRERGFLVTSRRGGGGSITISKINLHDNSYLAHIINNVGQALSFHNASMLLDTLLAQGLITARESNIMINALSDNALELSMPLKDILRARLFKMMLLSLKEEIS